MVVPQDGEIGDSVTQTFNISAVGDIEFDSEENDRIFEYSESLYVTNNGNSETSVELNKTLPDYMTPITSFDVSADRIEDLSGSNAYYWRFELEPGETASVDYRTRYWPPMVVLSVLLRGFFYSSDFIPEQIFLKKSEKLKMVLKSTSR